MAKKKTKESKAKSTPKVPLLESWKAAAKDRSVHVVFGLALIFIGVFMTIAFISFLGSWSNDQSAFQQSFLELVGNPDFKVHNVLSKVGASLGQIFVYRWFGIAAFGVPVLLTFIGLRISFKYSPYPLLKVFRVVIFSSIWLSAFMAYLGNVNHNVFAGGVGYYTARYMDSLLGNIGSLLLFIFTLLAWLILVMKVTPDTMANGAKSLFARFKREAKEIIPESNSSTPVQSVEVEDEVVEDEDLETEEESSVEIDFDEEPEPERVQPEPEPEPETPDVPESEIELEPVVEEKTVTDSTKSDEGPEFDVEEAAAEEALSEKEVNKKVKDFGEYDPKLDLSRFKLPPLDLLVEHGDGNINIDQAELEEHKNNIVNTLQNYKISIAKIKATIGPTVTLYEIVPEAGVRISRIKNLEDDIALSLAALGIRIIAPIPGRGTIGIEVPNKNASIVSMRAVLTSEKFQNSKFELPIALGKTISNETFVTDLAKMPHLLMAGATGQGKSVGLNAILASILYKKHPSQVKFVL
ncbi:MAG: DNA translocase FtsK, partial [Bacteroidetes bacterium]